MGLSMNEAPVPFWHSRDRATNLIEFTSQATSIGSVTQPISRAMFGFNQFATPGALPMNKNLAGLTFFTRPLLNLAGDNLIHNRIMAKLATTDRDNTTTYIRNALDKDSYAEQPGIDFSTMSNVFDNSQAFIPILSASLETISGWREVAPPTYGSKPGTYQEEYGFIDGPSIDYKSYDITATFRNVAGDPISELFMYWIHYMAFVFEGRMVPRPKFGLNFEYDFNTRIYQLQMDPTRTYVTSIIACGAAFPLNSPGPTRHNVDYSNPIGNSNERLSVNFRCFGQIFQDPILFKTFNRSVVYFNANMAEGTRTRYYTKIPATLMSLFRNKGYPWINPNTQELEWWVSHQMLDQVLGRGLSTQI